MKHTIRNLTLTLALTALLLTPALPALADGGAGPLGWFTGWLQNALCLVTGDQGPCIDPGGLQDTTGDEGPTIDPDGLHYQGGEVGPTIDPDGLQDDQCTEGSCAGGSEQGPGIDPLG